MQVLPLPQNNGIGMGAGIESILGQLMQRKQLEYQRTQQQQAGQQLSSLAQSLGMNLPQGIDFNNPQAQQVLGQLMSQQLQNQGALAEQRAKPTNPLSTDELLAGLLQIENPTQIQQKQIEMLKELKAKSGTNVTVNNVEGQIAPYESQVSIIKDQLSKEGKNPDDYNIIPAVSPAGRMYPDVKQKPVAGEASQKEIAGTVATDEALNNLETLFEENNVGPVKGRLSRVYDVFGKNSLQTSSFLSATTQLKNQVIREITGAQMSEAEAVRIMAQIPSENDPPTVWKAKVDETRKNLKRIRDSRDMVQSNLGMKSVKLEPNEVVVIKDGKRYAIPKEQLNEASKQGYKLSK